MSALFALFLLSAPPDRYAIDPALAERHRALEAARKPPRPRAIPPAAVVGRRLELQGILHAVEDGTVVIGVTIAGRERDLVRAQRIAKADEIDGGTLLGDVLYLRYGLGESAKYEERIRELVGKRVRAVLARTNERRVVVLGISG